MPVQLGALDFSPVGDGSPTEAIWNSINLARGLESLGYTRYWIAEHHSPAVAHSSPAILAAVIAGVTERMNVGAAGILLRFHSPLRVAKEFRLLSALYPGRIDLGIAKGNVPESIQELLRDGAPPSLDFEKKVSELLCYVTTQSPISVNPDNHIPPQVWILGKSTTSMKMALRYGTAFSYALFLADRGTDLESLFTTYKSDFVPGQFLDKPKCSIAVAGVCARTDDAARHLVGVGGPVMVRPTLVGSPKTCAQVLKDLAHQTGADEVVFLDLCRTYEDRRTSYELLAEAIL